MRRREVIAGLALLPLVAGAQTLPRVALAHVSTKTGDMTEAGDRPFYRGLLSELRRRGLVEGQSLIVERSSAEGRIERYPELAANVVASRPDVIVVSSARLVQLLKEATATIPIVAITSDPVRFGFAASLSRPGGNITGISTDAGLEIFGKYLELLKELSPGISKLGFVGPGALWDLPYGRSLHEVARAANLAVIGPPLESPIGEREYRRVLASMAAAGASGVLVADVPENYTNSRAIVSLVEEHKLVAVYPSSEFVRVGGLVSYGVETFDMGVKAAGFVDLILKGSKPADLPFQLPTVFKLAINTRAAVALGIKLSPALLARADEVIE